MSKKKYVISMTWVNKKTLYVVDISSVYNCITHSDISKAKILTDNNIADWVDRVEKYIDNRTKFAYLRWRCEVCSVHVADISQKPHKILRAIDIGK